MRSRRLAVLVAPCLVGTVLSGCGEAPVGPLTGSVLPARAAPPVTGHLSGTVTGVGFFGSASAVDRCPTVALAERDEMRGELTTLGASRVSSSHCNFGTLEEFQFADGQMIITAANGDELRLRFVGEGSLVSLDPAMGVAHTAGQARLTVTGGTGRFASANSEEGAIHASPSAVIPLSALSGAGMAEVRVDLEGRFSYVPADRSW